MRRCARKWANGRGRPDLPKGLKPTRWLWLTSNGALPRRRAGQFEPRSRAIVDDSQVEAVKMRDRGRDAEADPASSRGVRPVRPEIPIEDPLALLQRHARAIVADANDRPAGFRAGHDADGAALGRVFYRVVDRSEEHTS